MSDDPSVVESLLRTADTVRGFFGFVVLLALGVAFVVMGNTPGRLVGVGLLAAGLIIGLGVLRRRASISD